LLDLNGQFKVKNEFNKTLSPHLDNVPPVTRGHLQTMAIGTANKSSSGTFWPTNGIPGYH